ncbi:protealysin inhibitor emfourin [Micromonospora coxensis]|uniref:protealysin inhibitor emfourin n=1 Tax=Micromonospora coxensis TaxID=356852 RepID=UPI00342457CC
MSAMLRATVRVLAAFALLIGVGAGTLAVAGPARASWSAADRVTVTRTGGFAGVTEQYTVCSTTVHIYTTDLMSMASSREFRRLSPSYPAATGADLFTYTVTVDYRSGYTRTVTTQDTAEAPQVLWEVIDTTMLIDRELAAAPVH